MNRDLNKFKQLDTVLYPILPDNLDAATKFEENFAKSYSIYYDEKKKVNKMLKQEVKPLKFGRMPAMLIIDKKGIIQYAYYSDSMDDIPKNEDILEFIKKINK